MKIHKNYSLKNLNTFNLDVVAKTFVEIDDPSELPALIASNEYKNRPMFVLGKGSNSVFSHDPDAIILHLTSDQITIIEETDYDIEVQADGGHDWHKFVEWSVDKGWGGIENLAMIPGTVGAAPVQNIAAYGQNLVDVFDHLQAIDLETGEIRTFTSEECQFGYRTSIFKTTYLGKYLITDVTFMLNKKPLLETSYYAMHLKHDSIKAELEEIATPPYKPRDVFDAVVNIRTRNLPSVNEMPSVGSYFVNPIVTKAKLAELQKEISELQYYPLDQLTYPELSDEEIAKLDSVKIPAGRLLDELGWRGKQIGNCMMYEKHAMIVTHNGKATGAEILEFVDKVKQSCIDAYGVELETEVVVI